MSMRDFKMMSKIGEGAYSVVYRVKRLSDGKEYALKKVKMGNLSTKEKENSVNEVRIMASFEHPNIISYKEAFFEDATSSLCIVMEYADGGDLYAKICEHIKRGTHFSEEQIWKIFIQTVQGLKALHDLNILHRDLKSANVFLTRGGKVKLGDLNVSKIAKKGLLYTQTGTPYYASPEVWKDLPYDAKSDIWSLGCVLYEAITLKPPFKAQSMEGLNQRVQKGIYPKISSLYSQELSKLLAQLIQVNPKKRPTTDEILSMTIIKEKLMGMTLEDEIQTSLANGVLLGTIKIPKNLNILRDNLPKPAYDRLDTEQEKQEESKSLRYNSERREKGPEDFKNGNNSAFLSLNDVKKLPVVLNLRDKVPVLNSPYLVEKKSILKGENIGNLDLKLPEIKPRVVRRPAPRMNPLRKEDSVKAIPHQSIAYPIPNYEQEKPKYIRKINPLRGVSEEYGPGYRLNMLGKNDRIKPPVVHKVGGSNQYVYQSPINIRPVWWGQVFQCCVMYNKKR